MEHKPRKAMLRVVTLLRKYEGLYVIAVIPQWSLTKTIKLPVQVLPDNPKVDSRYIVTANVEVENEEDLAITDIKIAPDPDPNDGLTYEDEGVSQFLEDIGETYGADIREKCETELKKVKKPEDECFRVLGQILWTHRKEFVLADYEQDHKIIGKP